MDGQTDAEIRREARRRRILQNSDDRLRKIKGHSEPESPSTDISEQLSNGRAVPDLLSSCDKIDGQDTETVHLPAEPVWSAPAPMTDDKPTHLTQVSYHPTLLSKLHRNRIHIVILAVVVRIILLNDLGYLFGDMVLVPLLLVQLTELLMPRMDGPATGEGGLLGAALMLSGLTQSKAHGLLHVVCWLRNAGTNLALYLFSFFLAHVILQHI